jgi:ABC-2 type transport system ATP-binding protein
MARARIRYRLPPGTVPPDGLGGPAGPDGFTELAPDDVTLALHRLTGWAIEQRISLDGLEVTRPSLEDVYLALTAASAGSCDRQPGRQAAYEGDPA